MLAPLPCWASGSETDAASGLQAVQMLAPHAHLTPPVEHCVLAHTSATHLHTTQSAIFALQPRQLI
jgi:hypothetical protein